MADDNNPGQFGNREDTEEAARLGGENSSASGSTSGASGAAGRTAAARKGGKRSHKNR
ncbi:MAG TPA: hypothetical protein VFP32_01010 [Candidatus Saccharimonadales bacterium]|nr:hypothetical protein [Candidatus Saccharimonadales bacterium]